MMTDVVMNSAKSRYELTVNGETAYASYRIDGTSLYIDHILVPPMLRGGGVAGKLMEGIMELAKNAGMKVVPVCSYAIAWMQRHNEN
jgi:uncharacterized protein